MRNFKNYEVWANAMNLTVDIYSIIKSIPKSEEYNLKNQIIRSAVSIPSNIAEGCSRKSKKDFCRFLEISLGSAFELETQFLLCIRLGYFNMDQTNETLDLLNKTQRQINKLIKLIDPNR